MIKIEITIPDNVDHEGMLQAYMQSLGFYRKAQVDPRLFSKSHSDQNQFDPAPPTPDAEVIADMKAMEQIDELRAAYEEAAKETTPPPAKRGRRSKAQIEADAAAEAVRVMEEAAKAEQKVEERQISTTPEERQQDDADEKAETGDAISVDTVRGLAGAYVDAFGLAAANEDGDGIIAAALGPVPDGMVDTKGVPVTKWRLSVIPTDEDSLRKLVHAWTEALDTNPYNRSAV
jgi:hypothetical protein